MYNFNDMIKEAIKVVNGGKMLTFTSGGSKLTMGVNQEKDILNVSLNKNNFVLTGKDLEDLKKLLK